MPAICPQKHVAVNSLWFASVVYEWCNLKACGGFCSGGEWWVLFEMVSPADIK